MSTRRRFLFSSAASLACKSSPGFPLSTLTALAAAGQTSHSPAEPGHAIEDLTKNFLEQNGVSACQLAIWRNDSLVLSRSYAARPPAEYSPVDRNTLFRIASCSKMFTCAAITTLHARGDLELDTRVFPLLGINAPEMRKDKPDPHIDEITVQHLVDHAGGWNDHESVVAKDGTHIPGTEHDPMFGVRQIALDLHLDRPPTKLEIAQYMYGKPLQFVPGSQDFQSTYKKSYSNLGYMLLGLVVEKISGQPYIEFIRTGLGSEPDMKNVYLSHLLDGTKNPREVWYVCPKSELTALKPRSNELLPSTYGGGGYIPELHDSAGGLMTNAETLAMFSSRHAVWGLGGRAPRSGRSGSLPGTTSMTYSRPNGVDAAFVMNTREFSGGAKKLEEYTAELQSRLDQL